MSFIQKKLFGIEKLLCKICLFGKITFKDIWVFFKRHVLYKDNCGLKVNQANLPYKTTI